MVIALASIIMAVVVTTPGLAQIDGCIYLSADSLKSGAGIRKLSGMWKYHPGDDVAWADPQFDDRNWETTFTPLRPDKMPAGGWPAIGWFRLRVRIDSTLWNRPLALICKQFGASEIYLDGQLLYRFGHLGTAAREEETTIDLNPRMLTLGPAPEHLIAVRHANLSAAQLGRRGEKAGLAIWLGTLESAVASRIDEVSRHRTLQLFFTGVLSAFSLIHLLMFFFYPTLKRNLYFGIFTGVLAGLVFLNFQLEFASDLAEHTLIERLWRIFVVLAALSSMSICYSFPYSHMPRQFWVFLATGTGLGLASWYRLDLLSYVYVFVLVVSGEMLRQIGIGMNRWKLLTQRISKKKNQWVWIITAGMAAFILITAYQLLINLEILSPVAGFEHPYLFGILTFLIPVSSAYLFYDFAQTHRELEAQLVLVRELAQKTLAQERHLKEEELQRKLLEADNIRKTKELEEARRLQLSMLPQVVPEVSQLDIAWYMETATEVGGDYYDYSLAEDGTLTLMLGDATGHGLQSATVVTAFKSLFLTLADHPDITEIFSIMSRSLKNMNLQRMGMAMAIIKIKGNKFKFASAGIPPIFIYRTATQEVEEVLLAGVPLGLLTSFQYQLREFDLSPGDTILMLSDGLPERLNNEDEALGYHRTVVLFREAAVSSPREICAQLLRGSEEWAAGRPPNDDMSFVVLKFEL